MSLEEEEPVDRVANRYLGAGLFRSAFLFPRASRFPLSGKLRGVWGQRPHVMIVTQVTTGL